MEGTMKLVRHSRSGRLALVVEEGKGHSKVTPFDMQGRTEMWKNTEFRGETPISPRSVEGKTDVSV